MVEIWFEKAADLQENMEQPELKALIEDMRKHQEEFADLDNSSFFFTQETVAFDQSAD
jgi:hypothetical protein